MPFLTPQLLFQIKEIIRKHHTAFVANVFGHDSVPKGVLDDLTKLGLIDAKGAKGLDDAYLYGQAVALLEAAKVTPTTPMDKVLSQIKANPVPLTPVEQAAAKTARLTGASYVVGLGNTIDKQTGQMLIEADHALREKLRAEIADKTALAIESRKTVKQLKSDLGYATQDWTRNLDRIAITETHNAMQQGVADGIKSKHGDDARVAVRPMPDACPDCKRLHLGPDGHPRIFKLSQLAPPGANVKKPKAQWVPTVGAVHPHCSCMMIRIPNGWGFDKDSSLVPGGQFGVEHDEAEKSLGIVLENEERHRDALLKAMRGSLEKAYRHAGRMEFGGLMLAIEQDSGDLRHWTDGNGETGLTVMRFPYGFIENTKGADGEPIDCFVGPNPDAENVYVIDQRKKLDDDKFGGFDEQKVMLGFSSAAEAREAYLAHYDDPRFLGQMRTLPFDEFKAKVAEDFERTIVKAIQKGKQDRENVARAWGVSTAPPRFVLLEKAGNTSEVSEGESAGMTGAGVTVQGDLPPRPVNPQNANVRLVLTDPGNMRSDVTIVRDPEVYLPPDADGRLDWVYPLALDQAQMRGETVTDAKENRADLDRIAQQTLDVARNTVPYGVAGPLQPVEPAAYPIEKADGSVGGEGSRGGHVVGHTSSGKPVYEKKLGKEELDHTLKHGHFSIISAGRNPEHPEEKDLPADHPMFRERHEQLRGDLEKHGFSYTEVEGHYGGKEPSFIVHHKDTPKNPAAQPAFMVHHADVSEHATVRQLGQKYRQDSVVHSQNGVHEMHFTTGPHKGQHFKGEGHAFLPHADDFYTKLQHDNGTSSKFSLSFDFEKKHDFASALHKAGLVSDDDFEKAGPFIGPRGGKWANPQHTISWEPPKPASDERVPPHVAVPSGIPATQPASIPVKKLLEGNLGIKREDMPQIASKHVPDFMAQLQKKGVDVRHERVPAKSLRATQNELHADKIAAEIDKHDLAHLAKPVIVSNDNFLLDGHHRWAANVVLNPTAAVNVVRVDMPIRDLLKFSHEYENVSYKKAIGEDDDYFTFWKSRYDGDDLDEIEKALGHKYASKTWHAGHWIYEYAEKHAGKVRPHSTDENQLVVKFPKTVNGATAANALKGSQGLKGAILAGDHYYIVPVHKGELAGMKPDALGMPAAPPAKSGKPKPKALKQPAPVTKPPEATTAVASGPAVTSGTPDASQAVASPAGAVAGFDHAAAVAHLAATTGLSHEQLKAALTAPMAAGNEELKKARADIVTALFQNDAAIHKDALEAVLQAQSPHATKIRVEQFVQGSPKGLARAQQEYASVPLFDLAVIKAVHVHDKTIQGYATAHMLTGVINVGVRPNTGDWATGDWRHELGHVLHGSFQTHSPALDKVVRGEWEKAKARQAAEPHGPDNADWFETHWGVVGPRAVDDYREFIAEAYRGYHRARFQEKQGGPAKGSVGVAQYRERHPTMTKFFDAHYTAALLGELAKKGAW